jgi:hypothetical protein
VRLGHKTSGCAAKPAKTDASPTEHTLNDLWSALNPPENAHHEFRY